VCKMCLYFDAHVPKACREDDAEDVKEKERANFCDYFKPNPDAYVPGFKAATAQATDQLATLFGEQPSGDTRQGSGEADAEPHGALEDLFKK
jgi:hypothetical protein